MTAQKTINWQGNINYSVFDFYISFIDSPNSSRVWSCWNATVCGSEWFNNSFIFYAPRILQRSEDF